MCGTGEPEVEDTNIAAAIDHHVIDARFVAATDANLEAAIVNESFRAALLHRLEGYQLFVPPLRERRDDIGRLAVHFLRMELEATGDGHHLRSTDPTWLPVSFMVRMAMFDWPGNVRQLRNVMRQLAVSSRGSAKARIDASIDRLFQVDRDQSAPSSQPPDALPISDDALVEALRATDWQPNRAAATLGSHVRRSTNA